MKNYAEKMQILQKCCQMVPCAADLAEAMINQPLPLPPTPKPGAVPSRAPEPSLNGSPSATSPQPERQQPDSPVIQIDEAPMTFPDYGDK
jgi:hypothetical protein